LFKIKFVTNTTKESKSFLHKLLNDLGCQINKDEIFTSLSAAHDLIKSKNLRPLLFLEQGAMEDFEGLV
jgi:ribonucleotide monophosphatase NagD (HAD superfamily)